MIPAITQRLSVYKHNMEEQAEKSNQAIQGEQQKTIVGGIAGL